MNRSHTRDYASALDLSSVLFRLEVEASSLQVFHELTQKDSPLVGVQPWSVHRNGILRHKASGLELTLGPGRLPSHPCEQPLIDAYQALYTYPESEAAEYMFSKTSVACSNEIKLANQNELRPYAKITKEVGSLMFAKGYATAIALADASRVVKFIAGMNTQGESHLYDPFNFLQTGVLDGDFQTLMIEGK